MTGKERPAPRAKGGPEASRSVRISGEDSLSAGSTQSPRARGSGINVPAGLSVAQAKLPGTYEQAKTALATCERLDECKDWSDKAAALASYARQAEDLELERMAARIRARAMRRAGELLKQVDGRGGDRSKSNGADNFARPSQRSVAEQAGMSPRQATTAVRVANIPAADFDRQVESANPPTLTALAEQGKQPRAAPDPDTWLKGRDPAAFNKAMHFVALVEEYAADLGKADLEFVLPNLDAAQAAKVREYIAAIDSIHDIIATRI